MTGEQHRHQLVTKLDIGHRLVVLVAGAQQQRENIGAVLKIRRGTAEGNLLVDQRVRCLQATLKLAPRAKATEIEAQHVRQKEHGLHIEHGDESATQPLDAICVGDAEDGADDHLEGECPHPLAHEETLALSPSADVGCGDIADDCAEVLDGRSLKRR